MKLSVTPTSFKTRVIDFRENLLYMKIIVLTCSVLFSFCLTAQVSTPVRPFKPGDKVSATFYKDNWTTISGMEGKSVIIDAFTSGCIICFRSFPKINNWQQIYRDKLQFLLVGKKDATIEKTYERFKAKYDLNLPVNFDPAVMKLLGCRSFPEYIWINPEGIVKAVTGSEEMTEENIRAFLAGNKIKRGAEPEKIQFNSSRLFLLNGNGGSDSNFLFRSVLTGWYKGQPVITPQRLLVKNNSFQVLGITRDQLYKYAFAGASFWSPEDSLYERFYPFPVIESTDSACVPSVDDPLYCYSLFSPDIINGNENELRNIIHQDIERSFKMGAEVKRLQIPVWHLVLCDKDTTTIASRGQQFSGTRTYGGIHVKGFPMVEFIRFLQINNPFAGPFINDTGIKGLIDVSFDAVISDIDDLRKGLQTVGLDLIKRNKEMDVIVYKSMVTNVAAK